MNSIINIYSGAFAVFYREYLLLKNKLLKFGFVFYTIMSPVIYLLAFGFGFGSRITIDGGNYQGFLIQGIVCMSSMNNSYGLVANSISIGRLHSKSFQTIITAPIAAPSIMLGMLASGIFRGVIATSIIIGAGALIFGEFPFTLLSMLALLLNISFFSCLGVITGIYMKDIESNAVIANFVIMPMAFFSGTFYPIDYLPTLLKKLVYLLPLSHTNMIMRADNINNSVIISIIYLAVISIIAFMLGTRMISKYSE